MDSRLASCLAQLSSGYIPRLDMLGKASHRADPQSSITIIHPMYREAGTHATLQEDAKNVVEAGAQKKQAFRIFSPSGLRGLLDAVKKS